MKVWVKAALLAAIGIFFALFVRHIMFQYAFLTLAGAYFMYLGYRAWRQVRLMQDTPTSTARAVAIGPVELSGRVCAADGKLLKTPYSGIECVYYRCRVKNRKAGNPLKALRDLEKNYETNGVPFLLEDDTGKILVDPACSMPVLRRRFYYSLIGSKYLPERCKELIKANRLEEKVKEWAKERLEFEEYWIAPGDEIYVMGTASKNDGKDIVIGKGRGPFFIRDRPEKLSISNIEEGIWIIILMGPLMFFGGLILLLHELGLFGKA